MNLQNAMNSHAEDSARSVLSLGFAVLTGLTFCLIVVGALVRVALAGEGSLVDLVSADKRLGPEAAALLAPGAPVRRRTTPGGAGPGPVAVQRGRFVNRLAAQAKRIAD